MNIIIWLLTGILVGWIASKFFDKKKSLVGYLIIGILGSLLGGFLFRLLNIELAGYLGSIITSVIGAAILLFIFNRTKK